jgi:dipeptidyl aminopeptidase/acylaminoacyl peptidase
VLLPPVLGERLRGENFASEIYTGGFTEIYLDKKLKQAKELGINVSNIWLALTLTLGTASIAMSEKMKSADCHDKFSIEAILDHPQFSGSEDYQVGPDGKMVAYVLSQRAKKPLKNEVCLDNGLPARNLGDRISIESLASKTKMDFCPEDSSCLRPSWSPDSQSVAYYSDEGGKLGLWLYNIKTKQRTNLLPEGVKLSRSPGEEPKWSVDGKTIYVMTRTPQNVTHIQESKIGADLDLFLKNENQGSIVAVDLSSHKVRNILSADSNPSPALMRISPSGNFITYLSVPKLDGTKGNFSWELGVVNEDGKKTKIVADKFSAPPGLYGPGTYQWHPKRDLLLYVKDGGLYRIDFSKEGASQPVRILPEENNFSDRPLLFSANGEEVLVGLQEPRGSSTTTAFAHFSLENPQRLQRFHLPEGFDFQSLVQRSPNTFLSQDGLLFSASGSRNGNSELVGFDQNTRTARTLHEGGKLEISPQNSEGRPLVAKFEDLRTPSNLFLLDKQFNTERRLTHIGSKIPELGTLQVKYLTSDIKLPSGETKHLNTRLFLPPGLSPDQKPPTVMIGYPGANLSKLSDDFAGGNLAATLPTEILLRKGYAVALVDLPIGPEGKAGEPAKELFQTLQPQIDRLSQSGDVSPDHFALMGISHGGYFAAAVPTQLPPKYKNIVKAAIAVSGIYDLAVHHAIENSEMETGQGRMGGPPSSDPERYKRNSPTQNVDKLETPLLVLQGTKDLAYPEAQELIRRLKALGRNAMLSSYAGEGHVPLFWTLENNTHAVKTALDFLETI